MLEFQQGDGIFKNHTDVLIFKTAICFRAKTNSHDHAQETRLQKCHKHKIFDDLLCIDKT